MLREARILLHCNHLRSSHPINVYSFFFISFSSVFVFSCSPLVLFVLCCVWFVDVFLLLGGRSAYLSAGTPGSQ